MISAVITAGGHGTRLGGRVPKQFLPLGNKPLIVHTLLAFEQCKDIDEVIVVLPHDYIHEWNEKTFLEFGIKKISALAVGGDTRQTSVYKGLKCINPKATFVAIHDAARCLITPDMISKTIDGCKNVDGAIASVRISDSIKRVDDHQCILKSIPRENVWAMQTPQVFRFPLILEAYNEAEKKDLVATDDAQVAELLGAKVCVVEMTDHNFKITTSKDVEMAKFILEQRQ